MTTAAEVSEIRRQQQTTNAVTTRLRKRTELRGLGRAGHTQVAH